PSFPTRRSSDLFFTNDALPIQLKICGEGAAGRDFDLAFDAVVPDVGHHQGSRPGRRIGNGVSAVEVSSGANAGAADDNVRPGQGIAGGSVDHRAGYTTAALSEN